MICTCPSTKCRKSKLMNICENDNTLVRVYLVSHIGNVSQHEKISVPNFELLNGNPNVQGVFSSFYNSIMGWICKTPKEYRNAK